MGKKEMLAEIQRVSGPRTALGSARQALPTGHIRRRRPEESAEEAAPLGGAPRAARARAGLGAGAPAATAPPVLTDDQRQTLIDQALLVLQDLYAHLPLKRALHAIDPVQRLRLLRMRHKALDERGFQSEMIDIFVCLRDLHTNYTLPQDYWPKFAFLPFRVEEYYAGQERRYLVSWVSPVNTDAALKAGVEITHWNGTPIDLAVARNAAREAGSNIEARRARGLEALTLRWLGASVPPDEDWVRLTYVDGTKTLETKLSWQIVERHDLTTLLSGDPGATGEKASALGLDVKTELLRRVRKALFDPTAMRAETEMAERRAKATPGVADAAAPSNVSVMPDVFPRYGAVATPHGTVGYVRLATFAPPKNDVDGAVGEFVRILSSLPPDGLILDVRGNGGGYITFGERILQTLTPRRIAPEPFHFVTTTLTLRIAQAVPWLSQWDQPLQTALATGAGFSQGFPLTDPDECNDIGQVYQGPVVLVTDAFCYSTTDIFAAGFQDHGIGTILGCHDNTGAGGANVWDYGQVLESLGLTPPIFVALPAGSGMRVAARRSTRVGDRSGVPLEDLGVVPDERYYMTRNDLLKHNADLITHAARILAGKPKQALALTKGAGAALKAVRVDVSNIDRVDLMIDERPVVSTDVGSPSVTIPLPHQVPPGHTVTAQGFRAGQLVASMRLRT